MFLLKINEMFKNVMTKNFKEKEKGKTKSLSYSENKNYATPQEVKLYLGKDKPGYTYNETVNTHLSRLYYDISDIVLINRNEYHISFYFNDNTTIECWIANDVWGKANRGEIKKGSKTVYKWEGQQPSVEMMCYIDKLELNTTIPKINQTLCLFDYNKELDDLFLLALSNENDIKKVMKKNRSYLDCSIIEFKNGSKIIFNYNDNYAYDVASQGSVVSKDGNVEFEWNKESPNPLIIQKIIEFVEEKRMTEPSTRSFYNY